MTHEDELEIGDAIPRLTLRQLTYFLAAARQQSILRAADILNVSSPSISAAIAQLEDTLDIKLFERRHARGMVLTPAGNDLAAQVRSILLQVRELETFSDRGKSKKTVRVSIGCLTTLAPYVLPAMMREASEKYPNVQIRWSEDGHDNLVNALHSGAIDLALFYDYDLPTTLQTTFIRSMPVQAVLPSNHPLAQNEVCHLADLAHEPLILLDHTKTRDYFLLLFSNEGLEPRISYKGSTFETIRSLVANGFGYTLLNFVPPYRGDDHGSLTSRPLSTSQKQQSLVLARLYRYRAPSRLDDIVTLVRTVIERQTISC